MSHCETLRALLAPLGVYRWAGSFQWAELQSAGAALDGVSSALTILQREMNLTTAEGEGLDALCALLAHPPAREDPVLLRRALAALLRIGGDSFTLEAINDTISGCGIPAVVAETDIPFVVEVSFPGTRGIPADFDALCFIIEEILPCHLQVNYRFSYLTWRELEAEYSSWEELDGILWQALEGQSAVS